MASTHGDVATQLAAHIVDKPLLIQQLFWPSQRPANAVQNVNEAQDALSLAILALNLFLQINVTGPVPRHQPMADIECHFLKAWESSHSNTASAASQSISSLTRMRRDCVTKLQVDGVSPYPHISFLELFHLARHVLVNTLSTYPDDIVHLPSHEPQRHSISWSRLRIYAWHYKLLVQPSLGRSTFTKSSNWIELPSLATHISDSIDAVHTRVVSDHVWADEGIWTSQDKVLFLLEAANNNILLGRSEKAKELVDEATTTNHFLYALSGALGKRTKFQENSISQLVVLALSKTQQDSTIKAAHDVKTDAKPQAVALNDDTLLQEIHFTQEQNESKGKPATQLPANLATLSPDAQPQLDALDQITLLTEATIKDTFSPADTLTAEEILPFAVRVLADKSTNWQTYTQALLVRSRIELHRSRTVERGILQMQALADQVLTDMNASSQQCSESTNGKSESTELYIPSIHVSAPGRHTGDEAAPAKLGPTSFFPAIKPTESASADVRLRYIHALSTPPRWHLEAELAFAWASVGSLASALEIFKRLQLWPEVALCLASADAVDDVNGRGSGGETKAKAIIRWRLFNKTGADASASLSDPDDEAAATEDIESIKAADFCGPERTPAPANAPRLWCILGELENDPAHYERAWEVSQHRYARAQRSLAEYYLLRKDLDKAHEAYTKATAVNRLDPGMWSRLGDISLRLARFEDAAEAFNRSIGCASGEAGGEDAKTWSNLGTALWSLYRQVMAKKEASEMDPAVKAKTKTMSEPEVIIVDGVQDDDVVAKDHPATGEARMTMDPDMLLTKALNAYKKGAAASVDNWRIWENVVTIGCYMRPPPVFDIINAMYQILRIRQTETAVNVSVLTAMLQDEVLNKGKVESADAAGIYEPPHGTPARLITRLVEEDVVPLITRRAELWALVSKLRGWRRDYAGAVDAAEKAWRAAVGSSSSGSGLLPGSSSNSSDAVAAAADGPVDGDWTENEAAWTEVVTRTDELVTVLETWGPVAQEIGARWRSKARSAVRSVMSRGKTSWFGTVEWTRLEQLMDGLKATKE